MTDSGQIYADRSREHAKRTMDSDDNAEIGPLGHDIQAEEEDLRDNEIGQGIRYLVSNENDPVLQKAGVNVVSALAMRGLVNDHRNHGLQHHFLNPILSRAAPTASGARST